MSDKPTPQTLDALEARAWLATYRAAPAGYVAGAGLDLVETPDGVGLAVRDVPTGLFNRFRLTADQAPISAASVQRVLAWLGGHANAVHMIDAIAPPGFRRARSHRSGGTTVRRPPGQVLAGSGAAAARNRLHADDP